MWDNRRNVEIGINNEPEEWSAGNQKRRLSGQTKETCSMKNDR